MSPRGRWDEPSTGKRGPEGLSAYEVAVANGFVGSEPQWLDSLRGVTTVVEAPGGGGGSGTVTSVSASGSTGLTVGGSPITTAGVLTFTLQAATAGAQGAMSAADKVKLDAITGTNTGDQTVTLTGDVTGSGTGSFAATVAADAIGNTKLANMAQATIKGRAAGAGTGDPTDLTGAQVLAISGAAPAGLATASGLTMSTARLLGRTTAATGAIEEISVGAGLTLSAGALSAAGGAVADGTYADITVSGSGSVWSINAGTVSLTDMANLAANTLIGNNTGAGATPLALTATQVKALLAITGTDVTGAALTKVDDTNVTLTLGGTPATSLLRAASLTLGWTGSLAAARGGTGQTSYAVGDILYASTTSALSKLADVATGNALISGGVGAAPAWGKIALTTHVSGVLPGANGGCGVAAPSGTYTPTLTNVSNASVLTANVTRWMRIGANVHVSGMAFITPTATGAVIFRVSLPVASALTANHQIAGGGYNLEATALALAIYCDAASDAAEMQFNAGTTALRAVGFSFMYPVI